jgi:hypothetical protein
MKGLGHIQTETMEILNTNGCILEAVVQMFMKPSCIEKMLNSGMTHEDIQQKFVDIFFNLFLRIV